MPEVAHSFWTGILQSRSIMAGSGGMALRVLYLVFLKLLGLFLLLS
ncbi:hypothetical protein [Streptomyces sp. NPDC093260]